MPFSSIAEIFIMKSQDVNQIISALHRSARFELLWMSAMAVILARRDILGTSSELSENKGYPDQNRQPKQRIHSTKLEPFGPERFGPHVPMGCVVGKMPSKDVADRPKR